MFCKNYVKPQSMVTAKHNFQRLLFNPVNQNLNIFSDKFQKRPKDAFGDAAQAVNEQLINAKMPPHLIKLTHLEFDTYDHIVSDLEK